MQRLKRIERLAWGLGLGLIVVYGGIRIYGSAVQSSDLERFDQLRQVRQDAELVRLPTDFTLWSEKRIKAHERTLERDAVTPLAVLRIPKVELEVAVLEGTDDFVLDRAVGHVEGSAKPGEPGNVAIAGHRDGFFRGLKDIEPGDVIELETLEGTETYVVDELTIVEPDAVEVLQPTDQPSITLVTCYPFYFVGPAPQRFIVRGVRAPLRADSGSP